MYTDILHNAAIARHRGIVLVSERLVLGQQELRRLRGDRADRRDNKNTVFSHFAFGYACLYQRSGGLCIRNGRERRDSSNTSYRVLFHMRRKTVSPSRLQTYRKKFSSTYRYAP